MAGKQPCYKHPDAETRLRCSECERPVCTQCMVSCEVGIKCPECLHGHQSHLFQLEKKHYVIASGGALLAGLGFSFFFGLLNGFLALLWFVIGRGLGELLQKAIGYKLGTPIFRLVLGFCLLGMGLGPLGSILWVGLVSGGGSYLPWLLLKVAIFLVAFVRPFYYSSK